MLLDRYWHQEKQVTVKVSSERNPLDEAGSDFTVLETTSELFGKKIQSAKNIGIRKHLQHFFQKLFPTRRK
jgi:hypothetical protein